MDKQDFQTFRQQHSHQAQWTELANQEEIQYYLKMLLDKMPMIMRNHGGVGPRSMGQVPGGPQRFNNRQGGAMRGQGPRNNYSQNRQGGHGMHQAQMQNTNANPQMQMSNNNMMGQPNMMAQHQAQPQSQPLQVNQQLSLEQRYLLACTNLIYAVVPENPAYKEQVGTIFFEYIKQIVGPTKAPKVTGMLIDLPIDDIKNIMQDFGLLQTRVQQASELLDSQPQ